MYSKGQIVRFTEDIEYQISEDEFNLIPAGEIGEIFQADDEDGCGVYWVEWNGGCVSGIRDDEIEPA